MLISDQQLLISYQWQYFTLVQIEGILQTRNFIRLKWFDMFLKGYKTWWKKEKMLFTPVFFFFQIFFFFKKYNLLVLQKFRIVLDKGAAID